MGSAFRAVALYNHFSRPEHAHTLLDVHSRIVSPSALLDPSLLAG